MTRDSYMSVADNVAMRVDEISMAISLVEEAMNMIDNALDGTYEARSYRAYGRYGFDQLLGNGNPHDSSLYDLEKPLYDEADELETLNEEEQDHE